MFYMSSLHPMAFFLPVFHVSPFIAFFELSGLWSAPGPLEKRSIDRFWQKYLKETVSNARAACRL